MVLIGNNKLSLSVGRSLHYSSLTVNSVGVYTTSMEYDISLHTWLQVIDINSFGHWKLNVNGTVIPKVCFVRLYIVGASISNIYVKRGTNI